MQFLLSNFRALCQAITKVFSCFELSGLISPIMSCIVRKSYEPGMQTQQETGGLAVGGLVGGRGENTYFIAFLKVHCQQELKWAKAPSPEGSTSDWCKHTHTLVRHSYLEIEIKSWRFLWNEICVLWKGCDNRGVQWHAFVSLAIEWC